ncbi:MAG: hypothetical protein HYZ17_14545 [Betaproteobacteria bacterium]|nr:hypothetical protein [Betaproteobacteria bacterium]
MAIFRCGKCAHLQEQPDGLVGANLACPQCGSMAPVYTTIHFVGRVLDKYFEARREIIRLKADATGARNGAAIATEASVSLDEIDLLNTDYFASEMQHGPIYEWFRPKQIRVQANMRGVDTTGFFDEVALSIGGNLPVLKDVLERIRWAQQKEYASTTIHLEKKSAEDASDISAFCQRLYDFSFVAKCFHNRQENNVRLILQTAPAIRTFFNGEWLEWYALMSCMQYTKERKKRFSCARSLKITLQNNDSYELDVFMLIDGKQPICIECKSGEFRQDIERAVTLRKRLGISSNSFIMCVAGLSDEHAKGLSTMYDLTFANEQTLAAQLARVC